jgi:uncharacterized membrane protein
MTLLITGLVLFLGLHLLPTAPALRAGLVARLGAMPYKILFSVASLAAFAVLVAGKAQAPFVDLWQPPSWGRHLTMLLMLFAFIMLVAAYVPSNIRRRLRHPMLAAIKVWAVAHLIANGDLASLLLFGSFLAYAVYDRISVKRRAVPTDTARHPLLMDLLVVVLGVSAYAVVALYHQSLFGVPVILRAG